MSNASVSHRDPAQDSPSFESPTYTPLSSPAVSSPTAQNSSVLASNVQGSTTAHAESAPVQVAGLNRKSTTGQHSCPKCHRQRASVRSDATWLQRLFFEPLTCQECGCEFKKIPLRVWFVALFLTWSISMLTITLVK